MESSKEKVGFFKDGDDKLFKGGFGFTKDNELFVGRMAQLGFAASLIGELYTGDGPLGQLGDLVQHVAGGLDVDVLERRGAQHVPPLQHVEQHELDVTDVAPVVTHGRLHVESRYPVPGVPTSW